MKCYRLYVVQGPGTYTSAGIPVTVSCALLENNDASNILNMIYSIQSLEIVSVLTKLI